MFNTPLLPGPLREFQYNLAGCIKPMLQEMKDHERQAGLVRKTPETTHRILCDDQVQRVLAGPSPRGRHVPDWAKAKKAVAEFSYIVPRISSGQEDGFRFLWSNNIPIIMERIGSRLKGRWTPEAFVKSYSGDEVAMIRCGLFAPRTERVTVQSFFNEFRRPSASRDDVVKVKDWPPSADFCEKFLEYFRDFMEAVPIPSYTRDNGFMNLAAHYPKSRSGCKSFKPDLGPKMYVATRDLHDQGSTPLHVDVTSAINLLVHVEPDDVEEPSEVGATWEIFRAVDAPLIRAYLRRKGHPSTDPIHAQDTYLTEDMLLELAQEHVKPFRISQALGEAVFIPAGCPHQVSNRRACIKIACDFLCVEGVEASNAVSAEFREIHREDVLQLDAMLWYSWQSVSQLLELCTEDDANQGTGPSRRERKRKASRETSKAKADNIRKKRQRKAEVNPGVYNSGTFQYWCPHPACAGSNRPPFDFNGVLSHLRGRHELVIDQSWRTLPTLSPDELVEEFKLKFS
uniref:Zn(2)-C6 fungal-type domain-containing protein n=1 Tax=Ganoderma boninense TaxID=34458 RepID=A0A5K1JYI7_9APHY|nr:Zn(2)-C6 fungal-type domain-containing protein [Ganoderma boninense]